MGCFNFSPTNRTHEYPERQPCQTRSNLEATANAWAANRHDGNDESADLKRQHLPVGRWPLPLAVASKSCSHHCHREHLVVIDVRATPTVQGQPQPLPAAIRNECAGCLRLPAVRRDVSAASSSWRESSWRRPIPGRGCTWTLLPRTLRRWPTRGERSAC
jgi:hypothetical protein